MNKHNVQEAVHRLYKVDADQPARDYLSDLDNAFEAAGYRSSNDLDILKDVERYRIASAEFAEVQEPEFTDYGRSLREKIVPDLSEYWQRMARFQRDRITKRILDELEAGRTFEWMQLNGDVCRTIQTTASDLLRRPAPAHADDFEYYALCDKLFDHCKMRAIRDGRAGLNH